MTLGRPPCLTQGDGRREAGHYGNGIRKTGQRYHPESGEVGVIQK